MFPGFFYARIRCRDPFTRYQDKNAVHVHQGRDDYILSPHIIAGVLLYAVLRLSERF